MKILLFLLLLTTSVLAQSIEYDTLDLKGHIHSITKDVPNNVYTFVVDNVNSTESYIHQYQGKNLLHSFRLEDQVYHLYASSNGILYVTLNTSNRLLLVDYNSDDPLKSIDQKYAVGYADKNFMIASIAFSKIARDDAYYKKTGLALLSPEAGELKAFLPATFIIDVDKNNVLLKEIDKWGQTDERSRLMILNTETLEKKHLAFVSGNILEISSSLSSDGKFALITEGQLLKIYDVEKQVLYKTILLPLNPLKSSFVSENKIAVLESNNGGYQIQIIDVFTTEMKTIKLNYKALQSGAVLFDYDLNTLTLYSTNSNIVQRIKN